MAARYEAAEVGVAFGIGGQQEERERRVFGVFDRQNRAEDRLDACFARRLIKRDCRLEAVGIGERDGGHGFAHGRGDQFGRRWHGAKKGIVAVAVQVNEHGRAVP